MQNKTRFNLYYAPRYWLYWTGFMLFWWVAHLPVQWQIRLGKTIGLISLPFAHRRRHVAKTNLRLCFPAMPPKERKRLLREHFAAMGAGFIEVSMAWWTPAASLQPFIQITGEENLRLGLAQGKGVVLLSAHFTPLEIGGRLLSIRCPDIAYCAMYKPNPNPLINDMIIHNREKQFGTVVSRDDVRGILRALKQNKAVWYAPDQNVPIRRGHFVPFFGVQASTNTATPRIAKMSGAAVIPFFCLRDAQDRFYQLTLLPPLQPFPTGDDVADMRSVHAVFEQHIRLAPEQYFWTHRRFKKRPPGEAPVYLR